MRKLFARQLAKARLDTGEVDLEALGDLVVSAYEEADRDHRRTDRSMSLMIEEIGEIHQRLADAFDVVPEGIALFDSDDRYVMWNRRYAEMYATSDDAIQIGASLEEVLRVGLARGQYAEAAGREEEWLAERLARHRLPSSTHEQQLGNGRWIRVEERRTASGGSVGVRIDITELKQREESFRLLFENNPIPMFVCDAQTLALLAANEAAIVHYGYGHDQLLKMSVCDLRRPQDRDDARRLAQTGEGNHQSGQVRHHIRADGTQIDVTIYSKPLQYQGRSATLFASIDVTQQLAAESKLLAQKHQIDTAINNMSQGLVMFDADGRMILCNQRYIEIYGLSPDIAKPGCSLLELMRHRQQLGVFAGEPESYSDDVLATVARGNMTTSVIDLPDGRCIQGINRPMAGGGWVATHEDITERRHANEKIAHMAHYDSLTDLPNRVLFREHLEQSLKWIRRGERMAVFYLDIDRFKSVNDTLGHPVGDELLKTVAARLRACIKETDVVSRLSGDEFAIIQTAIEDTNDVTDLANRIHQAIREPCDVTGHQLLVETSIGITLAPHDGTDPDLLLKNADLAMYRAKADGRGTYRFFEPDMDARVKARRALEFDLREAIMCSGFELHYQPLVNLQQNSVSGCEALVRWRHPKRGLISPMEFIPVAEETGLINQLGEWVLRTACAEAMTWPNDIKIAVNVSPVQFKSGNLVQLVISALAASRLPARRLELEITEAVLIRDDAAVLAVLHQLRSLGVRIAMDDFGTGYSSLSYLQRFPFDKIKVDRSFIKDIAEPDGSLSIVQAIVSIAKSRNITTTAEGVETEPQLELLRTLGCTEMQGYLFSPARPSAEILPLLQSLRGPFAAVA